MQTITQACGHKIRLQLAGTAATRSAKAHELAMAVCDHCAVDETRGDCPNCGEPLRDPHDPTFCERCFQSFGE